MDISQLTPQGFYGAVPQAPRSWVQPALAKSAGPGVDDATRSFHPDSPVFWAVALGLVTFGLIGVSSKFRVGPLRVGASAGTS